jgi:hypothetical protein
MDLHRAISKPSLKNGFYRLHAGRDAAQAEDWIEFQEASDGINDPASENLIEFQGPS